MISYASYLLVIGGVLGGPVADPVQVEDIEAGTRDETGSLGDFVAELRDSLVVPLLLNPFEVLSINIKFMRRLKNEQIPG